MKIFYGLNKNDLWYVTSTQPISGAYIVIHAENEYDAQAQLFGMIIARN